MRDRLLIESGCPIPVPSMGLELYQPTIKDIARFGEENFSTVLSLVNYTKEDYLNHAKKSFENEPDKIEAVRNELTFMTDFQLILETANETTEMQSLFTSSLYLLIPIAKKVVIEERRFLTISFANDKPALFMTDDMFLDLREAIVDMFLLDEKSKAGFNPANDKAAQIAKKLEDRHKKLAKMRGEHEKETSALATAASIVSSIDGVSLLEVYGYTLPQLVHQLDRSEKYVYYKTQITLGAFAGLKDVEISDWRESI